MKLYIGDLEKKAQKLLGNNIHMLRLMKRLSQKDVASSLLKSPNAVSNWELGNTSPSIDDLLKLCDLFEVTPNQILGWENCQELDDFINETRSLAPKIEELKKQKKEIDQQLRIFDEIMNRKN